MVLLLLTNAIKTVCTQVWQGISHYEEADEHQAEDRGREQ